MRPGIAGFRSYLKTKRNCELLNLCYSDFEILKEAENETLDYPFLFF